jgi:hypothetical protein
LSTIVFLAIYLVTRQVLVAADRGGRCRCAGPLRPPEEKAFDLITYASVTLVVVLGGTTLLTHDQRFLLAKPSIAHFAIGVIMLKRGWMLRYAKVVAYKCSPTKCLRIRRSVADLARVDLESLSRSTKQGRS